MKLTRSGRLSGLVLCSALALSACASESEAPESSNVGAGSSASAGAEGGIECATGSLTGAGSSAQKNAVDEWVKNYQQACSGSTINYQSVGSGAGIEQFTAGTVDFAGSDSALKDDEQPDADKRCATGKAINLPMVVGPVGVGYKLQGVEDLVLDGPTLAKIFSGKITKWNDPAIAADNPDADLPDLKITPVNRSDDSGTTENFTDYLHVTAAADWPYEPDGVFPVKGGEAANGTSGVVQAITAGNGSIGYADASQVRDLGTVAIGVGTGFVEYSPEKAAAVVAGSPREEGREQGDLAIELARDTTSPDEYPLVLVSYSLACTKYDDAKKTALVKAFLTYVASEKGQAAAADNAGSAPLSDELRTDVDAALELIED